MVTDDQRVQILTRIAHARDALNAAGTGLDPLGWARVLAEALNDVAAILGDPWLLAADTTGGPVEVPE